MKSLKSLFIALFILTLIGAGVYAARNRGLFGNAKNQSLVGEDNPPAKSLTENVVDSLPFRNQVAGVSSALENAQQQLGSIADSPAAQQAQQSAGEQLSTLGEQGEEVKKQVEEAVSHVVQPNADETTKKPIQDAALEYGQYLYCKQVVDQYEGGE